MRTNCPVRVSSSAGTLTSVHFILSFTLFPGWLVLLATFASRLFSRFVQDTLLSLFLCFSFFFSLYIHSRARESSPISSALNFTFLASEVRDCNMLPSIAPPPLSFFYPYLATHYSSLFLLPSAPAYTSLYTIACIGIENNLLAVINRCIQCKQLSSKSYTCANRCGHKKLQMYEFNYVVRGCTFFLAIRR